VVEWPPLLASVLAVENDVAMNSDEQTVPRSGGFDVDYSGPLMPWMDYEKWVAAGKDRF
jgi:hypothetical protein